jgi:aspartate/methionine/tyrosine aminotransferase
MRPVRWAERATAGAGLNSIARVRATLAAAGVDITDLSDSNPTRHGLLHPGILDAVARHVPDAAGYQPHPRGPRPAREALATRFGGDPADYWLTSSTSEAYSWLFTLLADPGQAIAVPRPGYPLTEPLARFTGVRTTDYRLDYVHPDGWILDPESLERAVADPQVRAVVVVNPGNPTGSYLGAGTDVVVDACARHGIALIADEVFEPFALDGEPRTISTERRVPTFTLGGLSKLLCAPQLKLGWIRLSGPATNLAPLRNALDRIADAFLPVSGPIAAALPDLLALADESVATTRQRLLHNLAHLRAALAAGPYRVRRCDGGWTVLVDVPQHLPVGDLAVYLLRSAHLAVHPGWFYDLTDANTLALSLLPEPERFADGVHRLRAAIDALIDRSAQPAAGPENARPVI